MLWMSFLFRCPQRDDSRPLESLARWVSEAVDLGDWWSVSTVKVASVMLDVALELWEDPGIQQVTTTKSRCF